MRIGVRAAELGRRLDLVEEPWSEETIEGLRIVSRSLRIEDFVAALREFLGSQGPMVAAPSAHAALEAVLAGALPRSPRRVLISSLNCFSVASAVIAAGHQVDTFDVARNGAVDWESVAWRIDASCGAVVVPHLFGVPLDFEGVRGAARQHEVLVIEDCAHTLGASVHGVTAGTLGDAAIFSFNHDKPISLGGGGMLLLNGARPPRVSLPAWRAPSLRRDSAEIARFMAYLQRRRSPVGGPTRPSRAHSWAPARRGLTFACTGIGPLRAALGLWQLENYVDIVRKRNERARWLANATGLGWEVESGVQPAWLKQKLIVSDAGAGLRAQRWLSERGIPVGRLNWPRTVDERLGRSPPPNARRIALCGFDAPVHQNISWAQLSLIAEAFGMHAVANPSG